MERKMYKQNILLTGKIEDIMNGIKKEKERLEKKEIERLRMIFNDPEVDIKTYKMARMNFNALIDERFEILIKRLKDVAKRGRGLEEGEAEAIVNEFSEEEWGRIISEELKEEGERGIRRRIEDAYSKRREEKEICKKEEEEAETLEYRGMSR